MPATPPARPAESRRLGLLRSGARLALVAGVAALGLLGAAFPACSQESLIKGLYLEGGVAPHSDGNTHAVAAGVLLSGSPADTLRNSRTDFYWDVFGSGWRAPSTTDGRRNYLQLGVIATLRYRFDEGRSPWFADAGFGISTMDHHYQTPSREFSTDFQFTEALGLGFNFGEHRQYELSMRLQHVSNGGIREPNPGENFVRLRGSYLF
ncbi:lipid A 3-O-deacylase [Variovorax sp. OV329]|nr:lipid A 3-O-deacylase [Variovorax sp. OV329]